MPLPHFSTEFHSPPHTRCTPDCGGSLKRIVGGVDSVWEDDDTFVVNFACCIIKNGPSERIGAEIKSESLHVYFRGSFFQSTVF